MIVTVVPTGPALGVKPVTVGAWMTTKAVLLDPGPPRSVTVIAPVAAPAGTVHTICVDVFDVTDWLATPLNVTELALSRF